MNSPYESRDRAAQRFACMLAGGQWDGLGSHRAMVMTAGRRVGGWPGKPLQRQLHATKGRRFGGRIRIRQRITRPIDLHHPFDHPLRTGVRRPNGLSSFWRRPMRGSGFRTRGVETAGKSYRKDQRPTHREIHGGQNETAS